MPHPPTPLPEPTPALLKRLGVAEPDMWARVLAGPCAAREISTPRRLAGFLANIVHETAGMVRLTESMNYSARRLMQVWPRRFPTLASTKPFAGQPEALANHVYGSRMGNIYPGDGWRYIGRGPLQVTGRDNYARLALVTGLPLLEQPELLQQPSTGARAAAHWWHWAGCNQIADTGDIAAVRRRVNGGAIGLADVERLYGRALKILDPKDTP